MRMIFKRRILNFKIRVRLLSIFLSNPLKFYYQHNFQLHYLALARKHMLNNYLAYGILPEYMLLGLNPLPQFSKYPQLYIHLVF